MSNAVDIKILGILQSVVNEHYTDLKVNHNSYFKDLGINSISYIKLIVQIEAEYGFEFSDNELVVSHETVGEFINFIKDKLN